MIKTVIFDLDDTLYDFSSAHAESMRRLKAYARTALELPPERFDALYQEVFHRQAQRLHGTAAEHSRVIRYQMLLEAAGKPVFQAPEMAERYWNALLNCARPAPDAAEALAKLRFMGLTIGIGSNMTTHWQFAKLKRMGLTAYVDYVVTSEEAGAEKPDARFFALCAEKAGCAPEKCAFVGDSLKSDALGARDAGMHAFWLCRNPEAEAAPQGVERIGALSELPARVQSL